MNLRLDSPPTVLQQMENWHAHLQLGLHNKAGKTVLCKRAHHGPLVFQKLLYPEQAQCPHGVVIHPPGGIAGGDSLQMDVALADKAAAVLTTPGATKWYKSAGKTASQRVNIDLQGDASLEWLPQENILFDAANVALTTQINLSQQARFASWEIVSLGRRASGEKWQQGQLFQRMEIRREDTLIWHDAAHFSAESGLLTSIAGLRNKNVFGGFVIAAGTLPETVLAACRAIRPGTDALCGVSALPEIVTARYLGNCPQQARQYFQQLWTCLRPWYADKPVCPPRIWST